MQVEETTQSSPLRPTRASFVRGLPLEMPVEEVIERGREAGIQLQPSDIHAARYYMRQQGGSAPQQLMLGGSFSAKPAPRNGSSNGVDTKAKSDALEKTGVIEKMADDDDEDEEATAIAPAAQRRRKIVQSKATLLAQGKLLPSDLKDESVPLHDRLQARLANATFRETAKEAAQTAKQTAKQERNARKEELRAAKAERLLAKAAQKTAQKNAEKNSKATARAEKQASLLAAREERQSERETARTKQERLARQERLQKATIGKALLDVDSVKARKRTAQAIEVLEGQARLIALRLGTQRVRELLDAMEELARRA